VKRRAVPARGAWRSGTAFTPAVLARSLRELAGPPAGLLLCVAFSAGMDSTALLAACAALRARYRWKLRAVHVNHHLQGNAAAMAAAARAAARRLGVNCRVVDAPVAVARGGSVEAAARTRRYAALRAELRNGEWLLLAQHQDDQVEALLLQLLRGAGVAGLAAMAARNGPILRPLLNVTRGQLADFLQRRALSWSEDPSNADERLARNFLRRRVLPLLRERWPGLGVAVSRSAALAAEAQQLLRERAAEQLQSAHDGDALSVSALRCLAEPDRRNVLRHWLERRGLPMPDQRRLREIAGPLLQARSDAQPFVQWPGGQVRRHGGLLHALVPATGLAPAAGSAQSGPLIWNWRREPVLVLPDGSRLELQDDPSGELRRSALPARVRVAFRGVDGSVGGRPGGRRLKRLLQGARIAPWQRARVPLIYAGRRLLAVGESWCALDQAAGVSARTVRRCRLRWHERDGALI
jgi:tRNA(Ile)-lysidine synthase